MAQLKLVPTDVALEVQRLLWWQQIVGDPSSAWSFLFAFFGCVPGLPDVVDNSGATTPFSHSWLRLLVSDLQRLNNVLQLDDLDDSVAYPAKLFTDLEVKETFLYTDVHVLVAEWSTERIPPPSVPLDKYSHQLLKATSCCPLSVNRLYWTERCALRPSRPKLPWLRTKPTSRNMHEESNVALHLPCMW